MVLFRRAIFLVWMTIAVSAVFAQNSVSLEAEIQNMERVVNRQGISAVERHAALVRLARLRQLSGDIEGAAKNWLEAAAAIPGTVDDDALLACAYCLVAMGEWDRAAAALEPLLEKSHRARFLDVSVKAIQTGDNSPLAALAANPEYSGLKNEIYFMLWRVSRDISRNSTAAETWRQRLLLEFPLSPEGRLAANETSNTIIVQPSPFWLFIGGLDSLPLEPAIPATLPEQAPAPAPQPASSSPAVQPQTEAPQAVRLQTGLFSRQVNAEAQMANLRRAGFSPQLEQRGDMWAVVVTTDTDTNRSIAALRDAGFESFPLR